MEFVEEEKIIPNCYLVSCCFGSLIFSSGYWRELGEAFGGKGKQMYKMSLITEFIACYQNYKIHFQNKTVLCQPNRCNWQAMFSVRHKFSTYQVFLIMKLDCVYVVIDFLFAVMSLTFIEPLIWLAFEGADLNCQACQEYNNGGMPICICLDNTWHLKIIARSIITGKVFSVVHRRNSHVCASHQRRSYVESASFHSFVSVLFFIWRSIFFCIYWL